MSYGRPKKLLPGVAQGVSLPAPIGGLNTFNPAMGLPPTDCMMLRNMVAAENGLRVRLGSREWAIGLSGGADELIRTLIPYTGSSSTATRLFATTSTGIWDVTDAGILAPAYVSGTNYLDPPTIVTSHGLYFYGAGQTHATNGLPSAWTANTTYFSGGFQSRVINGGNVYICTSGGISANTGDGPTGTGTGISDGGCFWNYQSSDASITDASAIWLHIRNPGTAPTLACAFSFAAGEAGYGVAHSHTTTAGNFIWYADEENGLFLYTESTDTWTAVSAASVTGVDPADLVFATVFKGFSLFAVRDSTEVRVLPINSISGATSRMDVGYKSQAGGSIVGIWPWTRDGGSGLDDGVVFVTSGGDVMVYQGTDPTDSASFGNTGVWGVGKMPAGRNLGTKFGGDLLLLTRAGIVSMNTLTSGVEAGATQYQTAKVQGLFNNLMSTRGDLHGWSLVLHPEESALVVTVPQGEGTATTQLAMSLATHSWSELRDLDIYACASHEGKLYFGTTDGRVLVNDGSVDGVTLAFPGDSVPIDFQGIGAFQNFGVGAPKQAHLVKHYFLAGSAPPIFDTAVRFDFDLTELTQQVANWDVSGNVWDVAAWDSGTWSEGYASFSAIRGASGIGSHLAVVWRGWAVDRTILTGFELSFSLGGGL